MLGSLALDLGVFFAITSSLWWFIRSVGRAHVSCRLGGDLIRVKLRGSLQKCFWLNVTPGVFLGGPPNGGTEDCERQERPAGRTAVRKVVDEADRPERGRQGFGIHAPADGRRGRKETPDRTSVETVGRIGRGKD